MTTTPFALQTTRNKEPIEGLADRRGTAWFAVSRPRAKIQSWAIRSGFAILDQIAFSAANFLLHLFLLRWLAPAEFGRFALLFAIVLMGGAIHTSVVVSPMMVFASGRFSRCQRVYLGQVILGLHFLLLLAAAPAGAFLLLAPGIDPELALAPLGAVVLYATWTARKACYVRESAGLALGGSLLYSAMVLGGIFLLQSQGTLTGARVFPVLALAGFAAISFYSFRMRLRIPRLDRRWIELIYRRHLAFGKWMIATTVVAKSASNIFILGLALFHGFAAIALLKAAETLIQPVLQVNESLKTLILPNLVRSRRSGSFRKKLVGLAAVAFAMTTAYCAVLVAVYPWVNAHILNGKYPQGQIVLAILSASAIAWATFGPGSAGLRALELPREIFWPELRGTAAAVLAGAALTFFFAAPGAAMGKVLLVGLPGLLVALNLINVLKRSSIGVVGTSIAGREQR